MYEWNGRVVGLACLRCGASYGTDREFGAGCPACLAEGYPVSLKVVYDSPAFSIDRSARGLSRYADRLPYKTFPTLGEGNTPLFALPDLAAELGVRSLQVKNEGQNPTGSHKDRMSPFAVARAVALGKRTVVAASSGNAGASLAAYAAAANLRCVIITSPTMNPIWAQAIQMTGAELVATEKVKDRWLFMKRMVEQEDWYPVTNYIDPPVGSNLYGVQGYKTVGYEIVEQCGENMPDVIVVPTARADLLWGIFTGLQEAMAAGKIAELPRLVVSEPIPRLSRVLDGADYRQGFPGDCGHAGSIGGDTVTFQALHALQATNGTAVVVTGDEARQEQHELARRGLFWEGSSATAFGAVKKLVALGTLGPEDRVLMIATSNGYKDFPHEKPNIRIVEV